MQLLDELDDFDLPELPCEAEGVKETATSADCFACQFDALERENDED